MPKKSIAIVGSGVSGLSAAWFLNKQFKVFLIEKEPRLGGHTHTHDLSDENNRVFVENNKICSGNNIIFAKNNIVFAENNIVVAENNIVFLEECNLREKKNGFHGNEYNLRGQ